MEGKATVMRNKNLSVFFDMTYQGFATCDVNKDAVRERITSSHCQSYAQNMGVCGSLQCSLQRC
ncbi:Aspartate aminotransferase, mitochondrial [Myotis davidii]|uniref:Aspartate aminotransferase, mitochondrial n=1 Tax=Myotis davidii TaxID=225400 RepID=L5M969_MYODS|nr:Aspartate aminotransferase, mitochondrial [Myotis davidii]